MVLVLSSGCLYRVFCLWGWYLVWSLSPSSPDPCLVFVCVPLRFFCLVGFVDAVFSLPFSFSQGLGKPKPPSGGLGFPLCFFDLDAIAHSNPYSELRTYTMATPRTCLLFFCFRRRRRSFSGSGVSRFCPGGVGFLLGLFLVVGLCMHFKTILKH